MSDNNNDEIIDVKLPRSDYELLRKMLREREGKNWLTAKITSWWMFGVGSTALVIYTLYEKFSVGLEGLTK